eukprot:TRINITY_DN27534_c0_g1_i2.p1 TRINITY_DN27534_c0_g1~~TRINITY_DN27534_c0_g1_i2.p1  ORF type:complete len:176 (-),score=24.90 TRINITY_DN27534_c0_g1_i2:304-831(-)
MMAETTIVDAPSQQIFGEPQVVAATVVGAQVVGVAGQPVAHVNKDVNIVLGGCRKEELRVARMTVPDALAGRGITEHEWRTACDQVEEAARSAFFYNYPTCECIYWCVPLGPVQTCLCMLNPISWCCCILPAQKANERAASNINDILGKYGILAKIEDTMSERTVATLTSSFGGN